MNNTIETKIKELIEKGYSIRDIAKIMNMKKSTIHYKLKKYGLTTVYSQITYPKPKIELPIARPEDLENKRILWIDVTNLTVPTKNKHKKSCGLKCITLIGPNKKLAYITEYYDKTLIIQLVREFLNEIDIIICDKEFHYLSEVKPTFKAAQWSCSRHLNEKYHGAIKKKAYAVMRFMRETLGISHKDMLNDKSLLITIYRKVLESLGFNVMLYITTDTISSTNRIA